MNILDIKKVCIIGGGQMGKQIALNAAMHGFATYLTDAIPETLDRVISWADSYLDDRVAKGKMTNEMHEMTRKNFFVVKTLEEAASNADLVIEAIIEDKSVKEQLFMTLNTIVNRSTIIATNSSFMASSMFADYLDNPARLANIHYFNPALVMKLVEVVQGNHTSNETAQTLMEFAKVNGKTPILVNKEIEGFIANRILKAVNNEAFFLAENGYATPQDIDTAVEKGLNYPLGPFKLLDFAGLDIAYNARMREFERTGVKSFGYDLLERKVKAGELGRKTGKGFYEYSKED